jgi:hypothetical protein
MLPPTLRVGMRRREFMFLGGAFGFLAARRTRSSYP